MKGDSKIKVVTPLYVLKLIMLLASGLMIGAAYSFYGEHVHYSWIALGCLLVIALFYYRDISIWFVTKRMKQLERYVERQQKDPVIAFIAALTLGKNREASKALMKLKQTTFRWRATKYELHFLMMTKQFKLSISLKILSLIITLRLKKFLMPTCFKDF